MKFYYITSSINSLSKGVRKNQIIRCSTIESLSNVENNKNGQKQKGPIIYTH